MLISAKTAVLGNLGRNSENIGLNEQIHSK
jgi:hypothetical protein